MGLIYHAALENSLIMCFMDSRPWNAPLPVFFRLVDASKLKSRILKNQIVELNRRLATALKIILLQYNVWWIQLTTSYLIIKKKKKKNIKMESRNIK